MTKQMTILVNGSLRANEEHTALMVDEFIQVTFNDDWYADDVSIFNTSLIAMVA